jgi:hypothetical protein
MALVVVKWPHQYGWVCMVGPLARSFHKDMRLAQVPFNASQTWPLPGPRAIDINVLYWPGQNFDFWPSSSDTGRAIPTKILCARLRLQVVTRIPSNAGRCWGSVIPIPSAGQWWCFGICRPGSATVKWSQGFDLNIPLHAPVLGTIF